MSTLIWASCRAKEAGIDLGRFKDLCQRLDQLAAILEIMEDEPINVDLYREASDALNEAISEIERLRSDADLNRETSNALRDALAEIERLRSETADLQHTKFDGGLTNSIRHRTPGPLTGLRDS